jgi:hypothetical protein
MAGLCNQDYEPSRYIKAGITSQLGDSTLLSGAGTEMHSWTPQLSTVDALSSQLNEMWETSKR